MTRLRIGILLIILSWLPFAQLMLYIAHHHNKLMSDHASAAFRLLVWGVQILIGFIGLWLAGKIAVRQVRQNGWKQTPSELWRIFWHGKPHNQG